MDDFDFEDAMMLGTGYAMYRHGQDRQAEAIVNGIAGRIAGQIVQKPAPAGGDERVVDRRNGTAIGNAADSSILHVPGDWDGFVGQQHMKWQLFTQINAARSSGRPLPDLLLASRLPGVGKSTLARMVAQSMGSYVVQLPPPLNVYMAAEALATMGKGSTLLLEDVDVLTASAAATEILLTILDERRVYLPDGENFAVSGISVIATTNHPERLPRQLMDRFPLRPTFRPYSQQEMVGIGLRLAARRGPQVADALTMNDMRFARLLGSVSRGEPRALEQYVQQLWAIITAAGGPVPSVADFLDVIDVQPDGLTRDHVDYLLALHQHCGMGADNGRPPTYSADSATIARILGVPAFSLAGPETFLIGRGLLRRAGHQWSLTEAGEARARSLATDSTPSASLA